MLKKISIELKKEQELFQKAIFHSILCLANDFNVISDCGFDVFCYTQVKTT